MNSSTESERVTRCSVLSSARTLSLQRPIEMHARVIARSALQVRLYALRPATGKTPDEVESHAAGEH